VTELMLPVKFLSKHKANSYINLYRVLYRCWSRTQGYTYKSCARINWNKQQATI